MWLQGAAAGCQLWAKVTMLLRNTEPLHQFLRNQHAAMSEARTLATLDSERFEASCPAADLAPD